MEFHLKINMLSEKIKSNLKLQQILTNFIDVLRINILMVDRQGTPILVPKINSYGFIGSCRWGGLQYLGTLDFMSKFKKEEPYLTFIDSFGFQSFALPVGDEPIGYLIVGPVILNKPLEQAQYQKLAQKLNIKFSDFLDCLSETRTISFNSLKSTLDLLFEISQFVSKAGVAESLQQEKTLKPVQPLLTTLLDLAMALTQAECGSIMIFNKKTQKFNVQISKGINIQKFENVYVKMGEGIAGLAALKNTPFVINEGLANNRIKHLLKKPELKCAVILPIVKSNNEVVGVMSISTHNSSTRLATHSQQMLKSLTNITSNAMEQAFS